MNREPSNTSPRAQGGASVKRGRNSPGKGKRTVGKRSKTAERDSYSTLGKLVSKATKPTSESGYKYIDEETLRRIKAIAKQDQQCASGALSYLMQRMTAKSAEVRYMALSVIGQLFLRSKAVRTDLVADLKNFMHLAVGHDARQPLPGPPAAADALRQRALALMEEWNDVYGHLYKRLRAAYRFLLEGKRMKFPEVQARAVRERQEAVRRERHAQRLLRVKYFQAKRELEEQAPDVETIVREMQECFSILVPTVPGSDALPTTSTGTQARVDHATISRTTSSSSSLPSSQEQGLDIFEGRDMGGDHGAPPVVGRHNRSLVRGRPRDEHDGVHLLPPPRRSGDGSFQLSGMDRREVREKGRLQGLRVAAVRTDKKIEKLELSKSPRKCNVDSDEVNDTDDEDEGIEWEDCEASDADKSGSLGEVAKSTSSAVSSHPAMTGAGGGESTEKASMLGGNDDVDDDDDGDDEADDIEWEDGEGGDGHVEGGGEAEEKDEGSNDSENGRGEVGRQLKGKRARSALRTVADTVEAAGLGSSAYELQVEVPMRWSVSTSIGDSDDTALVLPALRERYKVLTSRILPLMSDWIHTLSRVTFGGSSMSPLTTPSASVRRQGSGGSTSQSGRVETPSGSERQVCADLLRRCLALRNSVNTVVSKFLELRIDEEGRDCKASTSTSRDNVDKYFFKWGEGSSSGLGSKRPRFQIRLDEAHSQAVRRAART